MARNAKMFPFWEESKMLRNFHFRKGFGSQKC